MLDLLILFAEGAAPAVAPQSTFSWFIIMLPALLVIIWIFMMNPQKKQEERMRNMLGALEKNDKVMTVGGIIGTVHSIDREQNEIVLKVDESSNTKVRFHLTAIATVFPKETSKD